jgi:hypothetical protein
MAVRCVAAQYTQHVASPARRGEARRGEARRGEARRGKRAEVRASARRRRRLRPSGIGIGSATFAAAARAAKQTVGSTRNEVGTRVIRAALSSARCLPHVVCRVVRRVVRCILSAACCPLHVVRCMLSAACCPLHVVRCMLSCYFLHGAYGLLHAASGCTYSLARHRDRALTIGRT